jgi:hypothetical protein
MVWISKCHQNQDENIINLISDTIVKKQSE